MVLQIIKATIINLIVAVLIVGAILGCIRVFAGPRIDEVISIANTITVKAQANKPIKGITINEENKITTYPSFGTKYATIEIPKIDVNLPVYYGASQSVLNKGVGHDTGTYFPGEGGSIIYLAHRTSKYFKRLPELENGDKITIKTTYGEFKYNVYDKKIIHETEVDKVPVQEEKEILMMYTCYPIYAIGHAKNRCVIYAEPVK